MSVQCTICGICQVAGDTEVKAQIRLQFRDVTGQKCMAIRSLVASQKVIFIALLQNMNQYSAIVILLVHIRYLYLNLLRQRELL